MVSRISCGSSSDTRREEDNGRSYITVSGVASERYADIAVLSDFSDKLEEADSTQLADGRRPETGQSIVILDDVAPLPMIGGYGRYFAGESWRRLWLKATGPGVRWCGGIRGFPVYGQYFGLIA